jgi:hypothetical protein
MKREDVENAEVAVLMRGSKGSECGPEGRESCERGGRK